MVAFYLQYTKKVVSAFILIAILTSCKCSNFPVKGEYSNCKEIKNYLDIELRLSSDTTKYDESLKVDVLFRNITDTTLTFYPKAIVFLAKPLVGFEYDSYSLNDTLDATLIAEIKPESTFLSTFIISVQAPFFIKGDNRLRLGYVCKEMKGKFQIYNKLCGSLESQEVKLVVIP